MTIASDEFDKHQNMMIINHDGDGNNECDNDENDNAYVYSCKPFQACRSYGLF